MKKAITLTIVLTLFITLLATGCSDNAAEKELVRGKWTDNKYVNDFAGLTFTMPEGWEYATDEAMAELMDIGADMLAEEGMEFSKALLEKQTIYDMMATNATTGTNIITMYENMNIVLGGSKYNETEYLEAVKEGLGTTSGYSFGGISDVKISGDDYKVLSATADIGNGIEVGQNYYVRKIGKYMFCIIVSFQSNESADTILANFS